MLIFFVYGLGETLEINRRVIDSLQTHLSNRHILKPLDEELVLAALQEEAEDHQDHRRAGAGGHRDVGDLFRARLDVLQVRLHRLERKFEFF